MMLVLVAITTEHVQVAVALATQTLVRCVMNVQAPGPSTALTTTAGKRQRTSSTCAPMGERKYLSRYQDREPPRPRGPGAP